MKAYRRIKLVFSGRLVDTGKPVTSIEEAGARIRKTIGKEPNEVFVALFVDSKHCEIGLYEVSRGSFNETLVPTKTVFAAALECRAAAMILAHNHPSGHPTPSRKDIELTKRLIDAGILLDIEVLDHLVITPTAIASVKETNAYMFRRKE